MKHLKYSLLILFFCLSPSLCNRAGGLSARAQEGLPVTDLLNFMQNVLNYEQAGEDIARAYATYEDIQEKGGTILKLVNGAGNLVKSTYYGAKILRCTQTIIENTESLYEASEVLVQEGKDLDIVAAAATIPSAYFRKTNYILKDSKQQISDLRKSLKSGSSTESVLAVTKFLNDVADNLESELSLYYNSYMKQLNNLYRLELASSSFSDDSGFKQTMYY